MNLELNTKPEAEDSNQNEVKLLEHKNEISRSRKTVRVSLRVLKYLGIAFGSIVLIIVIYLYIIPAIHEIPVKYLKVEKQNLVSNLDSANLSSELKITSKEIKKLDTKLKNLIPKTSYLIINTTDNVFKLIKNEDVLKYGKCSTGSLINLIQNDKKAWLFRTPKGVFTVKGKTTSPVWIKPDWAFVEEGLPIPSRTDRSRYESGVLGDYALALGQGYMIHGTIYQRFLGLPVTHGCVRLNDEDLDIVYHSLSIGSKVYIY